MEFYLFFQRSWNVWTDVMRFRCDFFVSFELFVAASQAIGYTYFDRTKTATQIWGKIIDIKLWLRFVVGKTNATM